ncbi:MAG TPA: vanadium-dependent haloperoxidase, partial [Saprospiraceae bacterium]|nr:vanadium-dependent haloperoxidase [Saprospiraceae bacterium]
RAKTDGTKNAVGNKTKWDSLYALSKTQALTVEPWKSLEVPARPPMLPFFKDVKPFLFPNSTLAIIRPPTPPNTNSELIKAQLAEVKKETTSGDRHKIATVHFWADGVGTYTPPGHWNYIAEELFYKAHFSEVRCARNYALLNMSMMDAAITCWETKNYYYYPRPSQLDPSIKTLTGVPNFQAYTSGHSTFSSAAATILGHFFPAEQTHLDALATEASLSRLYGGIHYRMDCEAGIESGHKVGNYAIQRAQTDGAE